MSADNRLLEQGLYAISTRHTTITAIRVWACFAGRGPRNLPFKSCKNVWKRLMSDLQGLLISPEQGFKTHPMNVLFGRLGGLFTPYFCVSSAQRVPVMLTERTCARVATGISFRELAEGRHKLVLITVKLWGKRAVDSHVGVVFWVSVNCGFIPRAETSRLA